MENDFFIPEGLQVGLSVAKMVGQPLREELPVSVELTRICNIETAEPGELIHVPSTMDASDDVIYTVDPSTAVLVTEKIDPINVTALTFKHLSSPVRRINLPQMLETMDQNIMARIKVAVTDGMDKTEVRVLFAALLDASTTRTNGGAPTNVAVNVVTPDSTDDMFDVCKSLLEAVEDYSTGGAVLNAGSAAYSKIMSFKKDHSGDFNYDVDLLGYLRDNKVEVVKISGSIKNTGDGSSQAVMDANKMILVGLESTNGFGKPITFVRRKMNPVNFPGLNVEVGMQRGWIYTQIPMVDAASGASTFGSVAHVASYGLGAYESVIFTIDNPKAIAVTADLSAIYVN